MTFTFSWGFFVSIGLSKRKEASGGNFHASITLPWLSTHRKTCTDKGEMQTCGTYTLILLDIEVWK